MLMAIQPLDQDDPPYTAAFRKFAGGGSISVVVVVGAWHLEPTRESFKRSIWFLYLSGIIALPSIIVRIFWSDVSYVAFLIPGAADLLHV